MRLSWFLAPAGMALLLSCGDSFSQGGGGAGGEAPMQCDVDTSLPCHLDGWVCANNGQTCSIDGDGMGYQCFNPGPKAEGEACTLFFGVPECQTNMICLQVQGAPSGTCRQWCSPTDPCKACPTGQVCATVADMANMVTLNICQVPP